MSDCLSVSLFVSCLSLALACLGWCLGAIQNELNNQLPSSNTTFYFPASILLHIFGFFVIRLFPSSSYSDVIIIILLENMFPIFFFVIIFKFSFYLIPHKGSIGLYPHSAAIYHPLCTLFSTQILFHFSFLYFFFVFYLFDLIFVSSFDMYTGHLYFRGFIYFKFSLYAISSQLFCCFLSPEAFDREINFALVRCWSVLSMCVGLPWDDATIQALCGRQEFGGAEHGGRVPAAPAERGQRVAPGGHDGRGLPSPGLDAVAAAALRRSRLMWVQHSGLLLHFHLCHFLLLLLHN